MAARVIPAAAVLTAAVVVYALAMHRRYVELRRLLVRERAEHHLVAGCMARDLVVFQDRLASAVAQDAVAAAAGRGLKEALAHHTHTPACPPSEGGPR